ncbi:hypothetical protein FRC00_001455 [Tulasnella sp. 408]|nr:hypothetical protein FRC00_001455 [Tulasnella sp. 408]
MVATVDGGAMANILDHRLFNTLAPTMGALHASNRTLVVASGWISMRGERAEVDLEILDSKGTFGILLGKPFLAMIGAVQDYARDALWVGGGLIQLVAQAEAAEKDRQQVHLAHNDEEVRRLEVIIAGLRPSEEEEEEASGTETASNGGDSGSDTSEEDSAASESDDESERGADEGESRKWMDDLNKGADVQALHIEGQSQNSTNLFTEERLTSLLAQVQIGADLSAEEHAQIEALVREFVDIFALSLSEVKPVDFIEHKLTIKEGASLPTRVHQRPLTEVQKGWYLGVLDKMEAAGIVCKISAEEVKYVSATTLAPKDSGGGGMTREEIVARANELC